MAISIRQKIVIAVIIFYATFVWATDAHAAIIKPANNLGLVGYWNVDEGRGTTAFDHSVGAHNGTLTSSPTWTTGKLGQAITFGAANNYVSTSAPWPSSGSISMWVYPTTYADWISPGGWKTDPNVSTDGYMLIDEGGNGTPGKWRFVARPNVGGASEAGVTASASITQNTWQHIIGTWSLSGTTYTIHLYVNGVDQGSATWTGTPGASGMGSFNFGKSGDYADNYFKGKVDDVRIYNRALPLSEVKALYNRTAGTRYNSSTATLGNGSTLQNGLVGLWTFDGADTSGTTATDRSGTGNDGTLTNSPRKVAGRVGQALQFNGSNTYVRRATFTSPPSSTMTLCTWLKTSYSGALQYILNINRNSGNTTNEGVFEIVVTTGKLRFWDYNGSTYGFADSGSDSNTAVTDGKWHYACFVKNGTAGTYYLDGASDGTATAANNISYGTADWVLGQNYRDANAYLNGLLDDVRVYNRALSAAEIKQLYQQGGAKLNSSGATLQTSTPLGSGLVSYWSFNGADVTDKVYDRVGSNNGYFPSGISTSSAKVQGKLGQGLLFNGSSNYIDIGDKSSLKSLSAVTVAAWVKTSQVSGDGAIASKGTGLGLTWFLWEDVAGSASARTNMYSFAVGNGSSLSRAEASSNTAVAGQWTHVVGVWQQSPEHIYIYINGVLSQSDTVLSGVAMANTSDPVRIASTGSGVSVFNGAIDEVRIYNRALSAAEVTQLYNVGR